MILGVPFFYLLTYLLNRILTPLIRLVWKKVATQSTLFDQNVLPRPVRLLILALAIRWTLSRLPLPLLVRQLGRISPACSSSSGSSGCSCS